MKTYKQFMSEVVLAAPLAIPVAKAIGAGLAATGLTGMIMKATKQGQGGRSQPTDYGQGGTATPRGKSVQRPSGKMTAADAQKRQAALDRKAEAKLRAQEGGSSPKVSEPKPTPKPKTSGEKVDPRLERAAGQVLDNIRKGR